VRHLGRWGAGTAFLAVALTAPGAAQSIREFDYSRPLRGEKQLRAIIDFGAGRLAVTEGSATRLYGLSLRYDAERFRPIGRYDADAAEVRLGVEGTGSGGIRVDSRRALPQMAAVEFPPGVALSLDVRVGAAESQLDLGGLNLTELEVKTGASRTAIGFDRPTTGHCRTASVSSGAGELTISDAGNSGCRSWRLDGGVGSVDLDLDGAWPEEARLTLNMALGEVTLSAPKSLGLKVRVTGFLAGFEGKGFAKEGKTYTSSNYESAARHLEIDVTSALGGVRVVWK